MGTRISVSLLDSVSAAPAHSFSREGKEEERSRRVTAAEVCTELAPSPLGSRRHRALTPIAAEHRPADPATVPPRHHTLAPASRGALASSPADGVALAQTIWLPPVGPLLCGQASKRSASGGHPPDALAGPAACGLVGVGLWILDLVIH